MTNLTKNDAERGAEERRAPVQGFIAGIPWDMHLRAYDAYCKRYSAQQALIEGGCRGGFSTGELDQFIPGWREEISVRKRLRDIISERDKQIAELLDAARIREAQGGERGEASEDEVYAAVCLDYGRTTAASLMKLLARNGFVIVRRKE